MTRFRFRIWLIHSSCNYFFSPKFQHVFREQNIILTCRQIPVHEPFIFFGEDLNIGEIFASEIVNVFNQRQTCEKVQTCNHGLYFISIDLNKTAYRKSHLNVDKNLQIHGWRKGNILDVNYVLSPISKHAHVKDYTFSLMICILFQRPDKFSPVFYGTSSEFILKILVNELY